MTREPGFTSGFLMKPVLLIFLVFYVLFIASFVFVLCVVCPMLPVSLNCPLRFSLTITALNNMFMWGK